MRKHIGKVKKKEIRRLFCSLAVTVAVTIIFLVQLDGELRPLVQNYGIQSSRRAAMLSVHRGVEKTLADKSEYDELLTVTRNENGEIVSAQANVKEINLLKSRVTNAVIEEIKQYENQLVRIPLGNLIGGTFFTGRGPFLKINIHNSGTVVTTLRSSFSDAGINQTCHRIYLKMTVFMTAVLPLERRSVELETEFLVCETVLVGEVPDSYADIHLGESETLSKKFGIND